MSVSTNSLVAAKIASGPAIPEITFTDLESLEIFADKQVSAFHESPTESQYILTRKISRHVFEEIDDTDHGLSGTRMHYDYKTGDLIAKLVPSLEQHALPLHLAYSLYRRIDAMNTDEDTLEYSLVGCATFRGSDSAKQGYWGFKPLPEREFCDDWPTFVMEVGVHESLERLRLDAEWWLLNSEDAVKIVLLIAYLGKERFTVERWKMGTAPTGESAATDLPEMASSISISRPEYSDKYVATDNLNSQIRGSLLMQPVTP